MSRDRVELDDVPPTPRIACIAAKYIVICQWLGVGPEIGFQFGFGLGSGTLNSLVKSSSFACVEYTPFLQTFGIFYARRATF